jgi:UDP-N-acetylglucosamine 2-epimerase (non-hydrolysing)
MLTFETGQHYDPELTSASTEFGWRHLVAGNLQIKGEDLTDKAACLLASLKQLYQILEDRSCRGIIIVSGDTIAAGITPFAWHLLSGMSAIHIEAGLRSMRPHRESGTETQPHTQWVFVENRPIPEGRCSRTASANSSLLFAPTEINVSHLLREGFRRADVHQSGSLSADAVDLALRAPQTRSFSSDSFDLRVDLHRRENLNQVVLGAVFDGLLRLKSRGARVCFQMTHSLKAVEGIAWNGDQIAKLENSGIQIVEPEPTFVRHIRRLKEGDFGAIYTDSGGLQEEAAILRVNCLTCRFETDRPETVTAFQSNRLVPPRSGEYIEREIVPLLGLPFRGLILDAPYGHAVAANIVDVLQSKPVLGQPHFMR